MQDFDSSLARLADEKNKCLRISYKILVPNILENNFLYNSCLYLLFKIISLISCTYSLICWSFFLFRSEIPKASKFYRHSSKVSDVTGYFSPVFFNLKVGRVPHTPYVLTVRQEFPIWILKIGVYFSRISDNNGVVYLVLITTNGRSTKGVDNGIISATTCISWMLFAIQLTADLLSHLPTL